MNKNFKRFLSTITLGAVMASFCAITPSMAVENDAEPFYYYSECENGDLSSDLTLTTNIYGDEYPGYTGDCFVWMQGNGTLTFEVTVPSTDMYQIKSSYIQYLSQEGRLQKLVINGKNVASPNMPYTIDWTEYDWGCYRLEEGVNTIQIQAGYGYACFDSITVETADLDPLNVEPILVDKKATPETQSLMNYLTDVYGKNIISGQQEIYGGGHDDDSEYEFDWIYNLTGEYPAIRGFDFMNYNPLYGWDDQSTERVIEWANERGGIATVCWHINVPIDFDNYELGDEVDWQQCTYSSKKSSFDVANAIIDGTKEQEYLSAAIDMFAEQLLRCQDAGVPIILRPYHEAEGNPNDAWFWWGEAGAEVYVELWQQLFTTLTEDYGLHNLIWEYNSYTYDSSPEWYPGDDYVDIVAYDKYNVVYNRNDGLTNCPNEDAISSTFYKLVELTDGAKLVAMSENDTVPKLENLTVEKAGWLYFCPWYGEYLMDSKFNNSETLSEVYTSDYCITLDELPDVYNYTSSSNPDTSESTTESVETNLGDVNLDGKIDISDIVAITDHIVNADKNPLSSQSKINADVSNSGDGITTSDASIIQQFISGQIDSLIITK